MLNIIAIILLGLLPTAIQSLKIEPDESINGLTIHENGHVYAAINNYPLHYSFNISVINELDNMAIHLKDLKCLKHSETLEQLNNQLLKENKMLNNFTNKSKIVHQLDTIQYLYFNEIINIKNNLTIIDTLRNKPAKCSEIKILIENIINDLNKLNERLIFNLRGNLSNDFYTKIQTDVNKASKKIKGFFPLRTKSIEHFVGDFSKISTIKIYISPQEQIISIYVPIVTEKLFTRYYISQKPSWINKSPKIVLTDYKYLVTDKENETIRLFNDEKLCNQMGNTSYCFLDQTKEPHEQTCETLALRNEENETLLKTYCKYFPLPEMNIISQSNNNIFFNIFHPLELNMNCNKIIQVETLTKGRYKVSNNTECTLSGSNFFIYPNEKVDTIMFVNEAKKDNKIIKSTDFNFAEFVLDFIILFFRFMLLTLIIFGIAVFFEVRMCMNVFKLIRHFFRERRERHDSVYFIPNVEQPRDLTTTAAQIHTTTTTDFTMTQTDEQEINQNESSGKPARPTFINLPPRTKPTYIGLPKIDDIQLT